MKKLLLSLASFVLFAQTILPNFLYATDAAGEPDNAPVQENSTDNADTNDTDDEADNLAKDNADQTDTPATESPEPTDPAFDEPQKTDNEAEKADEDDEEDTFVEIILDEGEEVIPYIPVEKTENAESNVMSTKKARLLESDKNDIYINSLNTQSLTKLTDIASKLKEYLQKEEIQDLMDMAENF
jgi:hypothetical protein